MKHKKLFSFIFLVLITACFSFIVAAEQEAMQEADKTDNDDIQFAGFELEKLLNLGAGLLAAALFIVTYVAYKRTNNKRLIYVSIAFFLFAIKGILTSHELFFEELAWVDPAASALNFAIILSFFLGIVKK